MQRLILAAMLIVTIAATVMSGPLGAGHQTPSMAPAVIDPTTLTLAAKNLPIVQVNEPF
jgi:ethanolamine utilization protein EutA (predicted chaperonin)